MKTTLSHLLGNNVQKIIHSKDPISFLGREMFYLNEYLYTFGGDQGEIPSDNVGLITAGEMQIKDRAELLQQSREFVDCGKKRKEKG